MRPLILTAAVLYVMLSTLGASASPADRLAHLAAASCVGEAGWNAPDEHRAILQVYSWRYEHRWGPRGIRMRTGIVRYSAAVRPEQRRRPWLLDLALGRTPPPRWPESASWERHRGSWEEALALTRRWVDGEDLGTPCAGAEHYGSVRDGRPAPGYELVACDVPVRNQFWVRSR